MIPGYIETIGSDDCRRLLGEGFVGRVAWASSEHGVQVFPVNYVFDGEHILFTVAPGGPLAELASGVDVVFQVDDLDVETSTGWSVIARGQSGRFDGDPEIVAGLPWAPGERDLALVVTVEGVGGRVVSADSED